MVADAGATAAVGEHKTVKVKKEPASDGSKKPAAEPEGSVGKATTGRKRRVETDAAADIDAGTATLRAHNMQLAAKYFRGIHGKLLE